MADVAKKAKADDKKKAAAVPVEVKNINDLGMCAVHRLPLLATTPGVPDHC